MVEITDNTDFDVRVRAIVKTNCALETLVLFRVVVSEDNLELTSLLEATLWSVGEHFVDILLHLFGGDLARG